ncbi:MAG: hypothetical protein IIA08_04070 [Proteobacteria bacterium]|nr:hypothetical protein [Pseudomonadota bacterium]
MIRLMGILCGSALAVCFLIVVLGVPEILPDTIIAVPPDVAVVQPIAEPVIESVVEPIAEPIAEPTGKPVLASENWYAFWVPFRSELAATGFIAQLQRTTGLDYRVLKQEPGVYAVAFAYSSAADIQSKLTAISTATGLEMPGD